MCLNVRNLFAEYPIPPKSAKATARLDTGQQPDATYRRHLIRIQIVFTVLRYPVLRVSCYGGLPIILSARSRLRCIRAGLVRSRRHAIPPPTSSHYVHSPHQPGLLHAAPRVRKYPAADSPRPCSCPLSGGSPLLTPTRAQAGLGEVRRCGGGS